MIPMIWHDIMELSYKLINEFGSMGGWGLILTAGLLGMVGAALQARAESGSATASTDSTTTADPDRHMVTPPRGAVDRPRLADADGSGGWWVGTAGVALVLAGCGGLSLASRRYLPQPAAGSLRVVGRTRLSAKHAMFLVKAGESVLIVGTGPQGPPALLGELTDPDEIRRLVPRLGSPTTATSADPGRPSGDDA
jgi:hypothetical protein